MSRTRKPALGSVRIIGGRWRGTRLAVANHAGLRPTPDRVRETVFNWLQPVLPGARVLDLFAGSGALGLESLSRGAGHATLIESDPDLAGALRAVAARLQGGHAADIIQADAAGWLASQPQDSFDIAFVDPPFTDDLWDRVLPLLLPRMREGGWLYLESPAGLAPALPANWALHREGRTREVRYALYARRPRALAGADTLAAASGNHTSGNGSDPKIK
ncbi:MAG: 16S rRNA (guanine(966)-N(2))-methyltransferase RsmD [Luteimonas sp.]